MTLDQLSRGQQHAIAELRRIQRADQGRLAVGLEGIQVDARGLLIVGMDLDCTARVAENGGAELAPVEHVTVEIPGGFPFNAPSASTLNPRLAALYYVYRDGRIPLYRGEADWDPSGGMTGFVARLAAWFDSAARGTLDTPGEPLDPSVGDAAEPAACVVIEANMPAECTVELFDGRPWSGFAVLCPADDNRVTVVGWENVAHGAGGDTGDFRAALDEFRNLHPGVFLAPTIVLPGPTNAQSPGTVGELTHALREQRVAWQDFVELIRHAVLAGRPRAASPFYALVGSGARASAGKAKPQIRLAAWGLGRPGADLDALLRRISGGEPTPAGTARELPAETEQQIRMLPVTRATVYECRPEVVKRRNERRAAEWLRQGSGRAVLVLGCGALGAPIAEYCSRGGARTLILVDDKRVTPGVLVRQPYVNSDIGQPKAEALARRLGCACPGIKVESRVADAADVIGADDALPGVDLIVDATGSRRVATMIELKRWTSTSAWPPVVTIGIGPLGDRGFAALARGRATGAGADIIRKLALAVQAERGSSGVAGQLFSDDADADAFVPESGYSAATFRGSAAEVQAVAAYLFVGLLSDLARGEEAPVMSARVVQLASATAAGGCAGPAEFTWRRDRVDHDDPDGEPATYQIRISKTALEEMRDTARRAGETAGAPEGPGGDLFGQIDAAACVVWVTTTKEPAPGGGERLGFIGIWRTHPSGDEDASPAEKDAMRTLAGPAGATPPRSLLVILGGAHGQWDDWLISGALPRMYSHLFDRG